MKSIIAAGILLGAAHGSVVAAAPYANIESNTGFYGSEYQGTVTDIHVGYEGQLGESSSWYIQGGPAIVAVDGEDTETEFSGKVGISSELSESLKLYGEYSFVTGEEVGTGVKAGVTYTF